MIKKFKNYINEIPVTSSEAIISDDLSLWFLVADSQHSKLFSLSVAERSVLNP